VGCVGQLRVPGGWKEVGWFGCGDMVFLSDSAEGIRFMISLHMRHRESYFILFFRMIWALCFIKLGTG